MVFGAAAAVVAGFLGLLLSSHHDDDFAFGCVLDKVGCHLSEGAPAALLVYLGNLAANAATPFSTEDVGKLLEGFHQTVGRLIENHRAWLVGESLQAALPAFLLRKEALEGKPLAWQCR